METKSERALLVEAVMELEVKPAGFLRSMVDMTTRNLDDVQAKKIEAEERFEFLLAQAIRANTKNTSNSLVR